MDMTTKQVSEATGLSMQRVQQWARSVNKQPTVPRKENGRPCMFEFTEEDVAAIIAAKGKYGPRP